MIEALKRDWHTASLTSRQRTILAYTEKLSVRPSEMTAEDLATLRAEGLNDEAILAIVLVAGFFQLATRIADALGVELDPELTRGTEAYAKFFHGST